MGDILYLPNRLFDLGLSGAEFCIIAALADFGRNEIEMRIRTMAHRCGLSPATVRRTLPLLQGKRLLDVICRNTKGANTYRAYRLRLPHTERAHFFCLTKSAIHFLSDYSPSVLLFYAYLVSRADKYGRAFGSDRGIARKLHISRSTVRNCADVLVAIGLVKKIDRLYKKSYQTKAHRTTEYDLQMDSKEIDPQFFSVSVDFASDKANTVQMAPIRLVNDLFFFVSK